MFGSFRLEFIRKKIGSLPKCTGTNAWVRKMLPLKIKGFKKTNKALRAL